MAASLSLNCAPLLPPSHKRASSIPQGAFSIYAQSTSKKTDDIAQKKLCISAAAPSNPTVQCYADKVERIKKDKTIYREGTIYLLQPILEIPNHFVLSSIHPQPPILPTIENRNLVIFVDSITLDDRIRAERRTEQTLKDYTDMHKRGMPIVTLHNIDSVIEDGYFIFDYLSIFIPPWTKDSTLDTLSKKDLYVLDAVRTIFFKAMEYAPHHLDLSPCFFACKSDGGIVLTNWSPYSLPASTSFKSAIKNWMWEMSQGNASIYDYLSDFSSFEKLGSLFYNPSDHISFLPLEIPPFFGDSTHASQKKLDGLPPIDSIKPKSARERLLSHKSLDRAMEAFIATLSKSQPHVHFSLSSERVSSVLTNGSVL